jgi:putative tryptophan/tyrosine transport system substrate-binding protein
MRRRDFIVGERGGVAARGAGAAVGNAGCRVSSSRVGRENPTYYRSIPARLGGKRFVEGRNVVIEYRLANGQPDRVPGLAAELVKLPVNVLASGYQTAKAAKDATGTIPIVFMGGADPVRSGLVASINRPGGNLTGVSLFTTELLGKRIGLLHELVPQATILGALIDARAPDLQLGVQDVQGAARRLGLSVVIPKVSSERDLDDAFASFARDGAGAIIVTPSTLFNDNPDRLVSLAARHRLPTVYELREFVEAGGLMSYAPSITEAFRQGAKCGGVAARGAGAAASDAGGRVP